MTKRFTSAGAMLAMRAVTGDYFLALGTGQNAAGLLGEATVAGYARQPVTVVARRATGTNAAKVTFGTFAASAERCTHAGLYTASAGGACIWVGTLGTPVDIVAGASATIAAGTLSLLIGQVETGTPGAVAPSNTEAPVLAGTAQVGELLTASTGTWTGTAPLSYAFEWQRGTTTIPGATAATYAIQAADLGLALRAVVIASNVAGAVQATSAPTAPVAAALVPPTNTVAPVISGAAEEGEVLTASTGTWSGTTPITYAFQWQRGATPITGATAASYTIQSADVDRTLRVIVTATNVAGTIEAASANTPQVAAAPLPGITIVAPTGPLAMSSAVAVSGSYSGTMTTASLVWEQNGNAVGETIAITSFSDGTWTATINAPETEGVYRLRATFNGTGPTATSDDVTIGTSDVMNLATFTFDGSGDGQDTVVVFGHSFPQGALHPTAAIVLRRADNNAALRTQMAPLTTWPDGTVKTAAFAGELPALANGTLLPVRLRRDEAHPSPGQALSWSGALAGRSIRIRTWAPGNTTTPLWTYDVAAALLASSDDWMTGPLAITRRVATTLPTSAVLSTSDTAPGPTTVRLQADVTATKDGCIIVDSAMANDALHVAGGGTARFGWTIEIDGTIVYDQRPATGGGRDLKQYNWWLRRRAKKGGTIYNFYNVFRPLFRPDKSVLNASNFLLDYDEANFPLSESSTTVTNTMNAGASTLTDAYPAWGIDRNAGAAGGRQEIGYKTVAQLSWAIAQNNRRAELLANFQAEAFAGAGWLRYDAGYGRPALTDEWPRFQTNAFNVALASRENALGFPTGQGNTNNSTENLTFDAAHRGPMYGLPALLSARRQLYDLLAFRSAEGTCGQTRWSGVDFNYSSLTGSPPDTPDHTTGAHWSIAPWAQQVRGAAWIIRDVAEAAYLLPSTYPRRDFYDKNFQAIVNMYASLIEDCESRWFPDVGLVILHTGGNHVAGFMLSFWWFGLAVAVRAGLPGATQAAQVLDALTTFRASLGEHSNEAVRSIISGADIYMQTSGVPRGSWAEVMTSPTGVPNDTWTANLPNVGSSDWQLNAMAGAALSSVYAFSDTTKARARDLLVRMRSERGDSEGLRTQPFRFANAVNAQSNCVTAGGLSWGWSTPPVLTAPPTASVDIDAAAGTLISLVDFSGSVPRCTTGSNANNDAFEIVSQPAGNPFTVSRGGVIRRSNTGTLVVGNQTLTVRARTIDENEVSYWSAPVTVTVNAVNELAVLSANQTVSAPGNFSVGTVVATFTYTGTTATSATIVSGNTGSHFSIHLVAGKQVEIRVANALPTAPASRTLTITVTNAAGTSDPRTCEISIVEPTFPPVWTSGNDTTEIPEDLPTGATVRTLSHTGSAATPSIVSTDGPFTVDSPTAGTVRIRTTGALPESPATRSATVRISNLAGTASPDIVTTFTITPPATQTIFDATAPSAVGRWLAMAEIDRRLVPTYTGPSLRLRRVSDNAEQDFGFTVGGELDRAAISAWAPSAETRVVRVYDHLTGNILLEQTTAASQFQLTNASGTFHTVGTNNRATLHCPSYSAFMSTPSASPIDTRGPRARYAFFVVQQQNAGSGGGRYAFEITAGMGVGMTFNTSPGGAGDTRFGEFHSTAASITGLSTAEQAELNVMALLRPQGSPGVFWRNTQIVSSTGNTPNAQTPANRIGINVSSAGINVGSGSQNHRVAGVMLAHTISNEDIAAVVNNQRTHFGGV